MQDYHDSVRVAVVSHFLRLSKEDRCTRFLVNMPDQAIFSYVYGINLETDNMFMYNNEDDQVVGVVHAAKISDEEYEFGVSVDSSYRGHGIGRRLFMSALQWAKNRNVKKVYVNCLAKNAAMNKIAIGCGATLTRDYAENSGIIEIEKVFPSYSWDDSIIIKDSYLKG
jgi:RimJ/RimL family protein N-acetyltransferase